MYWLDNGLKRRAYEVIGGLLHMLDVKRRRHNSSKHSEEQVACVIHHKVRRPPLEEPYKKDNLGRNLDSCS